MTTQSFTKWQQALALGGALLWTAIVGLAATGHAPLGVIELMFLFAPLVIVPLGLALAKAVKPVHHCKWESSLLFFHPFAAAATLISFWHSPSRIAGLLALPWMLLCGLEALAGTLTLMQQKKHNLVAWAINIGRLDLAIAGGWLVISRLGLRPIGIQEPIILLTAVHFHYTGFATALLAGTVLATAQRQNRNIRFLKILVASIIVIPFVVAAGFVWSAALKMAAAVLLSACLVCLAGTQLWIAPSVAP